MRRSPRTCGMCAAFALALVVGSICCDRITGSDTNQSLVGTWQQVPPYDPAQLTDDFVPFNFTLTKDKKYGAFNIDLGTYRWIDGPDFGRVLFGGRGGYIYQLSIAVRDQGVTTLTVYSTGDALDMIIRDNQTKIGPPNGTYVKVHLGKPASYLENSRKSKVEGRKSKTETATGGEGGALWTLDAGQSSPRFSSYWVR